MFILITIINQFLFQKYKDTDCYKIAGSSAQECKKFTTFVEGDPITIEDNVLYLCCYVNTSEYKGCKPIKEDVVFGNHDGLNFDCNSSINKIELFFIILYLLILF